MRHPHHRWHRFDRDASYLRLCLRARDPPRQHWPRRAGLCGGGPGRGRETCPGWTAGTAGGEGANWLPVPTRRPPDDLCARRMEHHRRRLRSRRRRLLPLSSARRRHDRLRGLQDRRSRGRRGVASASRGGRGSGDRRTRRGAGHGGQGSGGASAWRRARPGDGEDAAGFRQEPDRSLQIPAGDRVRRCVATDGDRQAAAVQAARKELTASKSGLKLAIIGGGPAGLYLSTLIKVLKPDDEVEVWERNAADDTFGFGVVFSDETLGGIENADPAFYQRLSKDFALWDDIDVHFQGQVLTSGGHAFAAISRQRLLAILRERCEEFGVTIHYRRPAPPVERLRSSFDLVVAADGVNSLTRNARPDVFQPQLDVRHARYMWLGTPVVFDAFKFFIAETDVGTVQAHAYPYSNSMSTFIVELAEDSWMRSGQVESAERSWK